MRARRNIIIIENDTNNDNTNNTNDNILHNQNFDATFNSVGDFILTADKKTAIIHKNYIFEDVERNILKECDTGKMLAELHTYPIEHVYLKNQSNSKIEQIINSLPPTIKKITIRTNFTQLILFNYKKNVYEFCKIIELYNLPPCLKTFVIRINYDEPRSVDAIEILQTLKYKMLENTTLPFGCDLRIE